MVDDVTERLVVLPPLMVFEEPVVDSVSNKLQLQPVSFLTLNFILQLKK